MHWNKEGVEDEYSGGFCVKSALLFFFVMFTLSIIITGLVLTPGDVVVNHRPNAIYIYWMRNNSLHCILTKILKPIQVSQVTLYNKRTYHNESKLGDYCTKY